LNLIKLQHANRHKKTKLAFHSPGMLRGVTSQKSEGLNYWRQKPENLQHRINIESSRDHMSPLSGVKRTVTWPPAVASLTIIYATLPTPDYVDEIVQTHI